MNLYSVVLITAAAVCSPRVAPPPRTILDAIARRAKSMTNWLQKARTSSMIERDGDTMLTQKPKPVLHVLKSGKT